MSILSYFSKEMNKSLILMTKSTTVSPTDYTVVTTYTQSNSKIPACVYSKALAEKYFGEGLWKADTKYVATVSSSSNINLYDHISMDSIEYSVDSIDDIAFQNEVVLIGLRGVV